MFKAKPLHPSIREERRRIISFHQRARERNVDRERLRVSWYVVFWRSEPHVYAERSLCYWSNLDVLKGLKHVK